jgi:ubiquinone/menaquinone biosynthesis C-methylase UbiE
MNTFNEIAEDFDPTRPKPWPESIEFIKSLPKHSRVIDLGCGNGRNSQYLAEHGFEVIGIDFSENMLKIATEKLRAFSSQTNIVPPKFIQADITNLPLRTETVDASLFIATLHHITSKVGRLNTVKELYRCLKYGGKALISVWAFDQPRFQNILTNQKEQSDETQTFLKNEPQPVPGGCFGDVYVPWTTKDGRIYKRFYHLFRDGELQDLLQETRFKVIEVYRVNDNYYAKIKKI